MTYSIWVWSTATANKVTASAASSARAMRPPRFTLCPAAHRRTCSIGRLPANQAFELMITARVRDTATAGEPMTLTVSISGSSLSPAVATITTIVGQTSAFNPAPPLPPTTLAPILGTTISPAGLSGLFPTVTPQTSPPATAGSKHTHKLAGITQTSSALPLDPRLIGGQLAGLAVLAAAITMVVARLSLRTPQTASSGPAASTAKADNAKENESDQPAG